MSCVVFRRGPYWHYRFQIKPHPRVQRSTGLRDKREAQRVATKAYDDAMLLANGGKPIPTLNTVIDNWMRLRAPVVSPAHVTSVDVFVRRHLYDLGTLPLDRISREKVELARLRHLEGRKPATANHWLRILKLLINWADVLPKLPFKVPPLKVQKAPRPILPVSAAAMWFDAVDLASKRRPGVGRLVRMMLFLGLRESEAITARWEWFDWERQTYTPGRTKGREAEPLPIPQWLVDYLWPLRQTEGLVACRPDGQPLPKGFAGDAMKAANHTCGLKGITPHRLRGTMATLLSESGVPIQDIQKFLRHKSPLTTMAYLEQNSARTVKAQADIGDRIGRASGAKVAQHAKERHTGATSAHYT